MKLVLKIQVTVVIKELVKSLQDTKYYVEVIHSSKRKAYVEQICIVHSCL